jgi:hypothetical protein
MLQAKFKTEIQAIEAGFHAKLHMRHFTCQTSDGKGRVQSQNLDLHKGSRGINSKLLSRFQ